MLRKMKKLLIEFIFLYFALLFITVSTKKECVSRKVADADTVCVCNATYCDDFPALKPPKVGFATVYESNKAGDRFKETELKFTSIVQKSNESIVVNINIDKNTKYQTILGFGAAFTDTTGQMLKSVNESLANSILDSYFSKDGIEYSMARIPIAGTDYSTHPYSYDDIDGDLNLTHFSLQKEDLEWKIPYIKIAQKISPHNLKFFGSPWSPPAWMKTNHKFNESGSLRGEVGGEYYQSFANYFIKFLDAYKSNNINFWGLTVENEPVQGWKNLQHPFNCLNLTPSTERDFVKMNLGPTLEKAGYGRNKLNLMIYDDGVGDLQLYANASLQDEDTAKYVLGIAYHWYGNDNKTGDLLNQVHQQYPNVFTLNSEACFLDGVEFGRWDYGEKYAIDIIRVLNSWVSGWVEWNLALDMAGGPRWVKDGPDAKGYGGTLNIDPTKGEAYKNPAFYAVGHFSKFIPPDSVRIAHKIDKSIDGLSVLTIKRPDNGTVLIAFNGNKQEITLNINDSNNYLTHKISANTIQSYIW